MSEAVKEQPPILSDAQFAILAGETKLQTAQQAAFQKKMFDAIMKIVEGTPKPQSEERTLAEKRDWFAGQALGAVVAAVYSGDITSTKHGLSEDGIAEQAYAFADAMLAERSKATGGSNA